ncbi:MAG: RNA polymerase sigma factor [Chloroflexota bacterium]|nr:MAG: RNA polymerase sigma factor [Chloroflexota bacterium]
MEVELVQRALHGDDDAYAMLVREHQEAVYRLAYLFVGDADDAEDVAQETFIRAHRALRTFDQTRPLRPWLLSITANVSKNHRRAAGRYLAALKRALFEAPPAARIEAESARQMEVQALWDAVRRLNTTDQEVIYLRYFLELSVAETAEVLAIEQGTVKSRLSRALGRLKGVVEDGFPQLVEDYR